MKLLIFKLIIFVERFSKIYVTIIIWFAITNIFIYIPYLNLLQKRLFIDLNYLKHLFYKSLMIEFDI
jgi:hypothetical protein